MLDVKNAPPKAGHKCSVEMGMRIQTAQPFERQGSRPSALGHYGPRRRIFADRSLADRILANRSGRRRRRLPARQIGSGGSTQHRKGCGRCGEYLQHDVAPLVCTTAWSERSARSNRKMPQQRQSGNEKGDFLMPPNSLSGYLLHKEHVAQSRRQLLANAAMAASRVAV
jgi:hypothetical protein